LGGLIRGETEAPRVAYCEVWKALSENFISDEAGGAPKVFVSNQSCSSILSQRAVRTPGKKYIVYAKPEDVADPRMLELDNDDFLTALYSKLLGRDPGEEGMKAWKPVLAFMKMTKKQVIEEFVSSQEYQVRGNFAIVDISGSNTLEDATSLLKQPFRMPEFFSATTLIWELSAKAVETDRVFGKAWIEAGIDEIKNRLSKLGYM
jgi:hypothetical protein